MSEYVPPRVYGLLWIGIAVYLAHHTVFHVTDIPTVVIVCIAAGCSIIAGILNVIYGK